MSFQQGLSGLNAAAKSLDVIGNNVANANTVGYKSSQAQFADVYASSLTGANTGESGLGVKIAAVGRQFTQGNVTASSNPLDIAINGPGFFRTSTNGEVTYTRNGQFHVDKDGYIVSSDNSRLTGYIANAVGAINRGTPTELRVSTSDVAPQFTTEMTSVANLDSRKGVLPAAGFDMNDPSTYHDSTALAVYDSLGNAHTVSTYFVKTAANTWDVFASANGAQIGAGPIGTLTFQSNGTIDTTATTLPFNISMPVTTGATTPLAFTLDLVGTTQFGSAFGVSSLTQDGYASGRLSGFTVGNDGVILGRYTNGKSNPLGQVVLANFNNPNGLQPIGGNAYVETPTSGAAIVGQPNTGNLGTLQPSSIEESNVDLTAELVNMITAQRFYQANAQTIKTQDAVLQTLVNLR